MNKLRPGFSTWNIVLSTFYLVLPGFIPYPLHFEDVMTVHSLTVWGEEKVNRPPGGGGYAFGGINGRMSNILKQFHSTSLTPDHSLTFSLPDH